MTSRFLQHPAVVLAMALAAFAAPRLAGAVERGPEPRFVQAQDDYALEARVIVKYRADNTLARALSVQREGANRPQHAAALALRLRVPLANGRVLGSRTQGLHGLGLSSVELAAQLAAMPEVEWAVPDRRRHAAAVPNDPLFGAGQLAGTPAAGQWYLRAPDATAVAAINAVTAWDTTLGSAGITVAILDTGVRTDHPDLLGKLHPGYDFVHDPSVANDGDGRDADAGDPGDWTTANECGAGTPAANSRWHGTQVAGLIGASTNNGIGMAGTGRNVMLLPVRVLGRCGGYDSDIIAAMRWAAGLSSDVGFGAAVTVPNTRPARVINMSLGSVGACPASYRDVIAELGNAGVSVVVAAGNDAGRAVNTPANCAGAIAVAGIRHVGSKVGYSNVGPEIAVAAPAGNCINLVGTCLYPLLTTTNAGTTIPSGHSYTDGTNATLGTSFAAPLVAGTVGLMLSVNPGMAPEQVRAALRSSARPFPTTGGDPGAPVCHAPNGLDQDECYCTTDTCGGGMLDTAQAVARAVAPSARIVASTTTPALGTVVTLDGSASSASIGRSIVGYQWSITSGTASAVLSGPTNAATVSLTTAAAGTATVQLAVTDSNGVVSVSSTAITVVAAAAGASSGGGAWDAGWLLGLVAATLLARRARSWPP